ncbi:MAG: hypothetical protein JRG89_12405 [Deltaproteobacteria bacterium]|nr:hypothetical protein [Deltaproteobacteria bacterium]MBW2697940.1 hypothetical protein [Deltaproteobacteria bacterium]
MRAIGIGFVAMVALLLPGMAQALNCPSGFIDIETGCYQEEQMPLPFGGTAVANWTEAVEICYDDSGGRLPTVQQHHIAYARFAPVQQPDPTWEWSADFASAGGTPDAAIAVRLQLFSGIIQWDQVAPPTDLNFRCYIPASLVSTAAVPLTGPVGVLIALGIAATAYMQGRGWRIVAGDVPLLPRESEGRDKG